jgi:hypothetical protein
VVDSVLPHYPEPLYLALRSGDEDSIQSVLLLWLAGWEFVSGNVAGAQEVLFRRDRYGVTREVEKALKAGSRGGGGGRVVVPRVRRA